MNAIGILDRALRTLYLWCGYAAAALIVTIACLVVVNIVSRLAGTYVSGMTEGAGYCMAGAGALGLAYTLGEHGHIRVTMLLDRFQGKTRFRLELWALLIATALTCYLAWFLARMVYISWLFEERSDGSDEILIWIPQTALALGFAVFAICLVHTVINAICRGDIERKKNASTSDLPAEG